MRHSDGSCWHVRVKGHTPWASPGACSMPADSPCHSGGVSLLRDRSRPQRRQGSFSTGSILEKEDVTQPPCNSLFLVTSAPSPVTSHAAERSEWDAVSLLGRPAAGLSEPGSLHAIRRNPPCATQGSSELVQKVSKPCQHPFGAAALKGDPAKEVAG